MSGNSDSSGNGGVGCTFSKNFERIGMSTQYEVRSSCRGKVQACRATALNRCLARFFKKSEIDLFLFDV